jgi:hypothetical protein
MSEALTMTMLVDYVCTVCGDRQEHWVPSPPPSTASCADCGARARRAFAAIGLSGSRPSGQRAVLPTADDGTPKTSLCRRYPQIPGLCHMSESAQKRWVATYLRDNRSLEREIASQEKSAKDHTPALADVITHSHHPAAMARAHTDPL